MTIRSMPPASSHLADRPVPAPPPMIGSPRRDHGAEALEDGLAGDAGHGSAPGYRRAPALARWRMTSSKAATSASAKAGSLMWQRQADQLAVGAGAEVRASMASNSARRPPGPRTAGPARRCAETPPSGIRKRTGPSHAVELVGDEARRSRRHSSAVVRISVTFGLWRVERAAAEALRHRVHGARSSPCRARRTSRRRACAARE